MRLPAAGATAAKALVFGGALMAASFSLAQAAIEIPGGSAGIGFDGLRFSPASGKVLVPAGRTGALVLVDPATRGVTAINGFSAKAELPAGTTAHARHAAPRPDRMTAWHP
jgi:hypothetical protein